jgi:hypothetical protein
MVRNIGYMIKLKEEKLLLNSNKWFIGLKMKAISIIINDYFFEKQIYLGGYSLFVHNHFYYFSNSNQFNYRSRLWD